MQDVTAVRLVDRKLAGVRGGIGGDGRMGGVRVGRKALLSRLAGALDLVFGALWVPGRDELTYRVVWHPTDSPALAAVAQATAGWRPGPGLSDAGPGVDRPATCRGAASLDRIAAGAGSGDARGRA